MGNIIKYSESTSPNSIKSGNFNVGVNNTPTDLTGFFDGISPIIGGYTIYINKASNGPSIYAPKNDTELIQITNSLGGSVETAEAALAWINSQSAITVINNNYPSIVTDGLVVNLDAGFVSSYPKTGTTWKDLSGNDNNGTLVNGSTYNGESGGSIIFDGVDDYCNVPFNNRGIAVNTVEMFFRWRANNNRGMFIGFSGYDIWTAGGNLGFNTAASDLWGISSSVVNQLGLIGTENQNWHHYVFVFSNQVQNNKIYINGVLQTLSQILATTNLTSVRTFSSTLRISGWVNSTDYTINGDYSYVRVYNRELTQQEITQNYRASLQKLIPTNGLVLSLDAQNTNLYAISPTTAYDVSGNDNNGALTNGVQYVSDGNGSWSFDGIDDYIGMPNFIGNITSFSVTHYIKLNTSQNTKTIFSNYGANNRGWVTGIRDGVNNVFKFYLGNTVHLYSNTTLLNNIWYCITTTYDNGNPKIYINGQLDSSSTQILTNATSYFGNDIGKLGGNNSQNFNGNISDVRIYNRALTATEITTIYNATKSRYGL